MQMRLVLSTLACSVAFVACGGGGGGGGSSVAPGGSTTPPTASPTSPGASATPTPTPTAKATATPTGIPYALPSSNPAAPSQLSLNSNPAGLSVTLDGAALKTPATASPAYGSHTVVYTPSNSASPYAVTFTNTGNGAISIFYNQTTDASGKIGGGIATSSVRRAASADANLVRRIASAAQGRPAYADALVQVQYDPGRMQGRTFDAIERAHGFVQARTLVQRSDRVTRILSVPPGTDVDAAATSLRREASVVDVERVGLRYPAASSSGTFYPNDPYFKATNNGANADQWYLWIVDAEDAWGYGAGKAPIAVIDTGYDANQSDLASLVTASETIVNLQLFSNTAVDTDGHGTFLSGVADAVTNNAAGFAGMGYNAPLQEYAIFAPGAKAANATDEAAAIREAVRNGAKVILLALQSAAANGPDPSERDAVAFAIQSGVTVVAASGDDGGAALDYPAAYPGVISVGASAVNDAGTPGSVIGQGNSEVVAGYSNAGPGLSLVAPGGQASGTGDTDLLHWIENLNTTQSTSPAILYTGTSPAAALVAGTASLMLTVNPNLAPPQVQQLLQASTDDIRDPREGAGRLNAQRAVALAAGDSNAQPALPLPRAVQFVAFAYSNSGAALPAAPTIVDAYYKSGVPVNGDGTFRVADLDPSLLPKGATTYKIAVWLSLAGDGKVHTGDYFASASCNVGASCSSAVANLTVSKITGGTLP